jgi:hypothetical protein
MAQMMRIAQHLQVDFAKAEMSSKVRDGTWWRGPRGRKGNISGGYWRAGTNLDGAGKRSRAED